MRLPWLKQFLDLESASAIILLASSALAMGWANSSYADLYHRFIGSFLFFINEGLMAVFFLMVGLELKREFLNGHLTSRSQILLPLVAALGGMIVPAAIYGAVNYTHPMTIHGWPTPVATDIAFALGILSLFGRRVPIALKLFLLMLAIFDDLGSILIIGFFYSHGLSLVYLSLSILCVAILYLCNTFSVSTLIIYGLLGVGLWCCFLLAGIHPTIAGVILGLFIPSRRLSSLEKWLHPYVAYLIMPLFALANAGFSLVGLSWYSVNNVVVIGIVLGLFIGKQIGVFTFSWLLVRTRFAKLPPKTSWKSFYGVAVLCGIGFTMSLFLGTLSLQNANVNAVTEVRIGVMIGSILSGLTGSLVLLSALPLVTKKQKELRR